MSSRCLDEVPGRVRGGRRARTAGSTSARRQLVIAPRRRTAGGRCRRLAGALGAASLGLASIDAAAQAQPVGPAVEPLRVCADPANLPLSNDRLEGFENRIAAVVAEALGRPVAYHWAPLNRGFVRKTLGSDACDVVVGVPADLQRLTTTRPYYRSSYAFVVPADDPRPLESFDDPRLPDLRIGVQLIGNDQAATPAGHALARHGATAHVAGFPVYGDGPAAGRIVAALAAGRLDGALVWGPQAGWFAAHAARPLRLTLAAPPADVPLPFEFGIAMGVRRGDTALRDALDRALDQRRADIDRILAGYAVPRTDVPAPEEAHR